MVVADRRVAGALGVDHLSVAGLLNDIGNLHGRRGELDQARRAHERALNIRRRVLGDDHAELAVSWHNLALIEEMRLDFARALVGYQRALELYERALGPNHADLAAPLLGIGKAHYGNREYAKAMSSYARALTIREAVSATAAEMGETRFAMARAMWEIEEEQEGAVELAQRARRDYAAGTAATALPLEEIDAWIREHVAVDK